jgi:protein CpxP
MKTTGKITLSILAGLGLAASAAVMAHEHGPMMGHGQDGCGPKAMGMAGEHEAHLSKFKTELKLTAAQEPAWQAFEKTVKAQQNAHHGKHDMTEGGDPMQARIDFMEQRLAGMKAVAKARADLFAVLTPEQKAVADNMMKNGPHG